MADFSFINDGMTRQNIENGYQAVTELELWSWLKTFEPEPGRGFMWSTHGNITKIGNKMAELPNSPGHSGSSFGFTMRHLHYIAKNGVERYQRFHETGEM